MAEEQLNQMINQLAQPVNPVIQQQQAMMGQGGLIQEADIDADGLTQEEFEQMQAALVASMADQDEIVIDNEGAAVREQTVPQG